MLERNSQWEFTKREGGCLKKGGSSQGSRAIFFDNLAVGVEAIFEASAFEYGYREADF
jgi:hypothetical protein